TEKNLVRTEALIEQASASQEDVEALNRMFQDAVLPSAPVFLGDEALAPAEDVAGAAVELAASRDEVRRRAEEAKPAVSSLRKAEERLQQLDQLTAVARAGLRFKPSDFDLKGAGAEHILAARRPVAASRDGLRRHLAPVLEGLAKRLTLAARLAQAPGGPLGGGSGDELPKLVETQRVLRDVFPAVRSLLDDFSAAALLLGSLQENQGHEGLISQLQAASERWRKGLAELWPGLARAAYPFEHAQGQASLADFLIGRLPANGAFGDILEALQSLGQKYYTLYLRVLGRLCRISERVEAALPSTS
ncbi:MAG TPA: hypothetical protein VEJ18_17265, partial [Planctomycetota bacterium]|nr:hypothetical protein [Planctomycetota bacterium]